MPNEETPNPAAAGLPKPPEVGALIEKQRIEITVKRLRALEGLIIVLNSSMIPAGGAYYLPDGMAYLKELHDELVVSLPKEMVEKMAKDKAAQEASIAKGGNASVNA